MISDAVEMQDSYTASHAKEVADLAVKVGERPGIDGVELAPVAPLVRSAHERHDGRGYPDGPAGDEIPRGRW